MGESTRLERSLTCDSRIFCMLTVALLGLTGTVDNGVCGERLRAAERKAAQEGVPGSPYEVRQGVQLDSSNGGHKNPDNNQPNDSAYLVKRKFPLANASKKTFSHPLLQVLRNINTPRSMIEAARACGVGVNQVLRSGEARR